MRKGFTVVEMLIIAGIFVIVSGAVLVNFRRGEHSVKFLLVTEELSAKIRQTQTQTLTGIVEKEIVASGGFGLYFSLENKGQYLLFRDDGNEIYDSGTDAVIETALLPSEITLDSLTSDPLTIVFKPPKPTVYINGAQEDELADIYLVSEKIADKRGHVSLNRLTGRITAQLEPAE